MGPHEGEWIRDEAQPPGGRPAGSQTPGEEWPEDGWPQDGWPGDGWPDGGQPGGGGGSGAGMGRGPGGAPGFSVRAASAVALLAAAAGVAAGFFLVRGTPAASTAGQLRPSAPAPSASGGTGLPGLPGNGKGQLQMILTGRVLAVSGTSITIGGDGPSVTAAVTSATKVTGTARGIGGVKVGDEVSAQLTGTASHLVATAIQDPASQ